jgi:hypothetical protein
MAGMVNEVLLEINWPRAIPVLKIKASVCSPFRGPQTLALKVC